jgi:hypothetical protein
MNKIKVSSGFLPTMAVCCVVFGFGMAFGILSLFPIKIGFWEGWIGVLLSTVSLICMILSLNKFTIKEKNE